MKKILLAGSMFAALHSTAQLSMIADFNPGLGYGAFGYLTPFQSKLVYFGDNGNTGNELYKYDGTGISLLYDMQPGTASSAISTITNAPLPVINNVMYLYADSAAASFRKIKKYDGSSTPVYINSGSVNYSGVTFMVPFNNKLYFSAKTAANGQELFVYDPGTDNVKLVKDIYPGSSSSNAGYLTVFNNKLYFTAATAATNSELFAYDPVADTAGMVTDLNPGMPASNIGAMQVFNKKMYFVATDGTHGKELYEYDGANAPVRLTDINPGSGNSVNTDIGFYKGLLFFSGQDASSKYQLYKYDPATATASLFQTLATGKDASPAGFIVYANKLFFTANNGTDGTELWMYDGSHPASMIADINTGAGGSSHPESFVIFNNDLYFTAVDYTQGRELFKWHEVIPVGVETMSSSPNISVYPNPFSGQLTVCSGQSAVSGLQLLDVFGRVVYSGAMQGDKTDIDTKGLANGNYLLVLADATGKRITYKIIKE